MWARSAEKHFHLWEWILEEISMLHFFRKTHSMKVSLLNSSLTTGFLRCWFYSLSAGKMKEKLIFSWRSSLNFNTEKKFSFVVSLAASRFRDWNLGNDDGISRSSFPTRVHFPQLNSNFPFRLRKNEKQCNRSPAKL